MKTLAVIPAFNEAGRIGTTVRGARRHLTDVIVVDDGSADATADEARLAGAVVLRHPANLGKGAALKTGFAYALQSGVDAVLTLDADGQHDPDDIPRFLSAGAGVDILVGARTRDRAGMPPLRRLTNRGMSWLISRLVGAPLKDTQSGYRLVRCRALRELDLRTSNYDLETEILVRAARAGFTVRELDIAAIYPPDHASHIHPLRDTLRFLRLYAMLCAGR